MAIVFDAASSGRTNSGTSLTFSHTVGSGSNRILIVGENQGINSLGAVGTVSGVTYGGVAMTSLVIRTNAGNVSAHLWYLKNPTAGTANVVITGVGLSRPMTGGAQSYFGVDQTTTFGTPQGATGTGNSTVTLLATSVGELAVDCAGCRPNYTHSYPGTGQNSRWNRQAGGSPTDAITGSGSDMPCVATSTVVPRNYSSSGNYAHVAVALKPAAAAVQPGLALIGVGA